MDGIAPLVLVKYYNINFDKIINTNYGENGEHSTLQDLNFDDEIIYVDFTPDENARKIILDKGLKCHIFDHHESVVEEMNEFVKNSDKLEYTYDVARCGTKIYYDYLISQGYESNSVLDEFTILVNTYDLWQKNSDLWIKSQNLNRLLFKVMNWGKKGTSEMYDFFVNGVLWKCQNMMHYEFSEFEQKKIDADIKQEDNIFEEFVSKKRTIKTRKDEKGDYFAIIKLDKKISIISNRLLEKYKGLSYLICINEYDKENPKISIRSKEEFSLLDKLEGCKGHDNAMGYENPTIQLCEDLWNHKINGFKRLD